jgi:hypothetical protein
MLDLCESVDEAEACRLLIYNSAMEYVKHVIIAKPENQYTDLDQLMIENLKAYGKNVLLTENE